MPATAYLAPPRPISLYSVLDATTSMSLHPALDLDWEPFQNHVEAFLNAVRPHSIVGSRILQLSPLLSVPLSQ